MKNQSHKTDILALTPGELDAFCRNLSMPAYRARQVFTWLYRGVRSFDEMTDLPASARQTLAGAAYIRRLDVLQKQQATDGTVKLLYGTGDGNAIEAVVMRYQHGVSVCISSQAGCRMACIFCASGERGLSRDLTASEMLCQVVQSGEIIGQRISNVVVMGTGEPLDNMENLLRFLELIRLPGGLGISHRHISVSTCGLCDGIGRLAREKPGITLSVSLHSPFDDVRSALMPVNKKYPIAALMETCREYFSLTGRRISFEYTLIKGVNDRDEDAAALGKLLRGQNCHLNLIPFNPTGGDFVPSSAARIAEFKEKMNALGVNTTVRRRLGRGVDAACGQLRLRSEKDGKIDE